MCAIVTLVDWVVCVCADEQAEAQMVALNEELTSLKLTVAELEKERYVCVCMYACLYKLVSLS
jgi:hypothetical protein